MIPPVLITALQPSNVIKVIIKEPYMAMITSAKDGIQWLSLVRPRRDRGIFRSQLFGIVTRNDGVGKVIDLRIPDFRTLNIPDRSGTDFFMLELEYNKILSAQVFQPNVSMPPETVIVNLNRFVLIGQAGKFKDTVFIPSAPVLLI